MGTAILVLGKSGSGKSTSLRNFAPDEVGIFNVLGKPLPFRGGAKFPQANRPVYRQIMDTMRKNNLRCYVVDDSTFLMQNENFNRAREKGYDKFTEMALHFQQLISTAIGTDRDTIVYFLHHVDEDVNGNEKVMTVGKMLDEKWNIAGACPVVIDCVVEDGNHVFVTENNGRNLAKAPMGSLPEKMDNDLKAVDTALREYWGMKPIKDGQEMKGTEQ